MGILLQDIRYGLRRLRKRPGFTVVAVLTLALGVGANTAIFSVVDQVLLRPLPLSEPEALLRVQEQHRHPLNLTGATFQDLHQRTRAIAHIMAYRVFARNLTDVRQSAFPEQIDTAFVSQDFFAVAGQGPRIGHEFAPDHYGKNAPPVLMLSDSLWRRMFGADPTIVGKTVLLHGEPATVVGVMPPGFGFPEDVQAWAPLTEDRSFPQNRRSHLFTTIGRLKPGVSLEEARAELRAIGTSIDAENHGADPGLSLIADGLQESIVGDVRPALMILLSAVGFVLLIACANVVNLLLSRALSQQKEIAMRIALGATSIDIIRQTLSESLLLAFGGGLAGAVLGLYAVRLVSLAYPGAIPRLGAVTLDWRVVLFAATVSVVSAAIAGVLPALHILHANPLSALAGSGRSTETWSRSRFRHLLLTGETALAVVLLAGAGLLIRSFLRIQQVNPGYSTDNIAVMPVTLPDAKYPTFERRLQFVNSALGELATVPGVRSVAAAGVLPLHGAPNTDFELAGKPLDPENEPSAFVFTATPDYFRTLSVPLLAGRSFLQQDRPSSPTVVLINQAMANRYYPGENPVGRMITMKDWGDPLPAQIVGVVGDTRQDSLEVSPTPAVYFSYAQFPQGTLVTYLLAKTEAKPQIEIPALRERIRSLDKGMPVQVSTMQEVIADSLTRRRFMLTLLSSFAGLALLLAMLGVYGVISYSVSQRTREFGIRLAVGAQRHQVLAMIVREGLKGTARGVAVGVVAGLCLTRAMRSLLYGVNASDPLTYGCIIALLLLVAIAASLAPAYRATKVDPIDALRSE